MRVVDLAGIEAGFEAWGYFAVRHRWAVVLGYVLATALFVSAFPSLRLDISLDHTTILIGAIIIGLAVDDTIHFMHKFQRYYAETGDAPTAIRETLTTTGAAMLFTTLALCCGFFIFTSAYLSNIARFGLLCGIATIVAFLADIVLAPALVVLATHRNADSHPINAA
jgi:predicted RND superfamily exporter protein